MIKNNFNVYKVILCLVLAPIYLSVIGLLFATVFDGKKLYENLMLIDSQGV